MSRKKSEVNLQRRVKNAIETKKKRNKKSAKKEEFIRELIKIKF